MCYLRAQTLACVPFPLTPLFVPAAVTLLFSTHIQHHARMKHRATVPNGGTRRFILDPEHARTSRREGAREPPPRSRQPYPKPAAVTSHGQQACLYHTFQQPPRRATETPPTAAPVPTLDEPRAKPLCYSQAELRNQAWEDEEWRLSIPHTPPLPRHPTPSSYTYLTVALF